MKEKQIGIPVEELEKRLGPEENIFGIITRTKLAKCSGGLFNRKTLANWDSNKIGFDHKLVHDNGQVAYYLDDVKKYIQEKYRVVTKKK